MRLTDYSDRLESLLDDGYSPAQARRIAGSGQRCPQEPRGAADEGAEGAEEPDADESAARAILNEWRAQRSKGV